ncbi:VOC family protein [Glycomyces arizonensis]|uniref:VOC family protein n=1 Tax=Glycomyces arizonensis TaxID=256035 RepID=UPI0004048E52|nr:VOC family protein [Glycomyces arizonensis]
MLHGFTTTTLIAADVPAAKAWYTEVLGTEPYFDRDGVYVEFRFGDYQHELGILDARFAPQLGLDPSPDSPPSGPIVYCHVDDVEAAFERLLALGAKELHAPRDFGEGFVGAAVRDPFGNALGVMRNPHYAEVLAGLRPA